VWSIPPTPDKKEAPGKQPDARSREVFGRKHDDPYCESNSDSWNAWDIGGKNRRDSDRYNLTAYLLHQTRRPGCPGLDQWSRPDCREPATAAPGCRWTAGGHHGDLFPTRASVAPKGPPQPAKPSRPGVKQPGDHKSRRAIGSACSPAPGGSSRPPRVSVTLGRSLPSSRPLPIVPAATGSTGGHRAFAREAADARGPTTGSTDGEALTQAVNVILTLRNP